MKVTSTDRNTVLIELETAEETAALWAVAGHIGGTRVGLSGVFSSTNAETPGLYQALMPIVAKQTANRGDSLLSRAPLTIKQLLKNGFASKLSGRLEFAAAEPRGV